MHRSAELPLVTATLLRAMAEPQTADAFISAADAVCRATTDQVTLLRAAMWQSADCPADATRS
jgi:hypothetical protein